MRHQPHHPEGEVVDAERADGRDQGVEAVLRVIEAPAPEVNHGQRDLRHRG